MRSGSWLFVVSAGLFIGAIVFLVAGERNARRVPAAASARPALVPVASVKQIMNAIVMPNATVLYDSVGSSSTAAGIVEIAPDTDEEWMAVADSAAALVEAGNLMLMGDRAVDSGDWVTMTRKFTDAARASMKAASEKKADGIFESGGDLAMSCDTCHERYQRR